MQAAGPKKIVVKTLKRPTEETASAGVDFHAEAWAKLLSFIRAVQALQYTNHSFQELYDSVTNLVMARKGPMMYEGLRDACKQHVASVVSGLAAHAGEPAALLDRAQAVWAAHLAQIGMLRSVFIYLDTSGGAEAAGRLPIADLGVALFREQLLGHVSFLDALVAAFVAQLTADRRGEGVSRPTLAAVSRMLTALSLYASHVDPPVVAATRDFYRADADVKLASMDTPSYLVYAEDALAAERDRISACLNASVSGGAVIAALEKEALDRCAPALLERSLTPLLVERRTSDIRRMFTLFSRAGVGRTEDMRRGFSDFCRARVMDIVAEGGPEKDKGMVQALLDAKAELEGLIAEACGSHPAFAAALKSALELGVNAREGTPAELIARFLDLRLRLGPRGAGLGSDDELLERVLEPLMVLFRCIQAKDVFEAFYKKDLAKRLILGKSASADLERTMIGKLKAECGAGFTAKLEGMMKDAGASEAVNREYQTFLETLPPVSPGSSSASGAMVDDGDDEVVVISGSAAGGGAAAGSGEEGGSEGGSGSPAPPSDTVIPFDGKGLQYDMSVQVLTAAFWPSFPAAPVRLPPALARGVSAFAAFYARKAGRGHKLQWVHAMGTAVVKATFPGGNKELDINFYQALTLLAFAPPGRDVLTFAQLKTSTGIEEGELKRVLQSLSLGQARVLRKGNKGPEVTDAEEFSYNADFKAPLIRLKIPMVQAVETKAETAAMHERVAQDRQHQIDAAAVRIMKARKSLPHTQLMAELFAQLRFPVKAGDVKKRLESLIDREYLERDEADGSLYHYVA